MTIIKSFKFILLGFTMLPLAFGTVATSLIFSSYNIALSRNPEEKENLYNNSLVTFVLIETFIFISLGFSIVFITIL
jgi:F0F1-type ATP synthase membrane subunit c/vacuolar-type H+-ATPase subunit K